MRRENALELTAEEKQANYESHRWGVIDDVVRCVNCEIGIWNGQRRSC